MRSIFTFLCCAAPLVVLGCSGDAATSASDFSPTPAAEGFTRYSLIAVPGIAAGSDVNLCQWLTPPIDHDMYVLQLAGQQSVGGHHLALYGNKKAQPVGTTRECTTDDMLNIDFIGGVGGEGTNSFDLPAGVGFRLPKGYSLMANAHFVNTKSEAIVGNGVVDVKFGDRSQITQFADLFASTSSTFDVPANQMTSAVTSCVFPHDVSFFRVGNHMHEWGSAATSSVLRANGQSEVILQDDAWSPEMVFNPPFQQYGVDSPLTIHAGEKMTTNCTWSNTTSRDLTFPEEMCVSVGFYLTAQGGMITCSDGEWSEGDGSSTP